MPSPKVSKISKVSHSKTSYDVAINVTAHAEKSLLHKTLRSIEAQILHAKKIDPSVRIQLNISLDKADETTTYVASRFTNKKVCDTNLFTNDFGDASLNRNFLVENSRGEYLFFHDGDDFFSENFLAVALATARQIGMPAIVTAEFVLPFDKKGIHYASKIESTTVPEFIKTNFFGNNGFVSQNLVHHEIYENIKYEPSEGIYAYEDWHWNTKVIAAGYDFYPATGTLFFYQQKSKDDSLRLKDRSNSGCIRPTPLFEPNKFLSLGHVPYELATPREISLPITSDTPAPAAPSKKAKYLSEVIRPMARKVLNPKKKPYKVMAHQYRSIQQLLAPATAWVRSLDNVSNFFKYQKISFEEIIGSSTEPMVTHTNQKQDVSIYKKNLSRLRKHGIGKEQLKFWQNLNQYAHEIIYDANSINDLIIRFNYIPTPSEDAYYNFCSLYAKEPITDILLIPHLTVGGADNAMIHLVNTLCAQGRRPLVITTEDRSSPAKPRITCINNAQFMEMRQELQFLGEKDRMIFLCRVLQHFDIKTLTVMNSTFGYNLLSRYGQIVSKNTRCMIHSYAQPRNELGMIIEYFPMREAATYSQKVITDSQKYADSLANHYGWKNDFTKVCYLPTDADVAQEKTNGVTHRIFFMARLASEKKVDTLLKVAKALEKHDILLDIYGIKDPEYCDRIDFDTQIKELSNVRFLGRLTGFGDLNVNDYDLMLITSSYEGIPITLLDTVKANLFVISSGVGGIKEVIFDGKNGLVVDDYNNVKEYVDKVLRYYSDETLQDIEARKKFNESIAARHSVKNYTKTVQGLYEA